MSDQRDPRGTGSDSSGRVADDTSEPAPARAPAHAHLDPLIHVAEPDHPDAEAEARAEAGRAVRDLGHALVGRHAPVELIQRLTRTLDEFTAAFGAGAERSRGEIQTSGDWLPPPHDGTMLTSHAERPVSGRASPLGLDVHVRRDGDEAVASLTLRAAHEGAPGRSHGGVVASLFDDIFGFVLTLHAQPGFTGELTVRYVKGTPIGRPLECRVRLSERKGRKLLMTGELTDTTDGTVVARGSAVFIAVEPERFISLVSGD